MKKKRDPVVIDVQPEELHREPAQPKPAMPRHAMRVRATTRVQQMRELQRAGRIVQTPDFWLGLLVDIWRNGR